MGTLLVIGLILIIVGVVAHFAGAGGAGGVALQVGKWLVIIAAAIIALLAILGLLDGGSVHFPTVDID